MAYNGINNGTTTIADHQSTSPNYNTISNNHKLLSGDSGNDSLITTRCSQHSPTVDDLDAGLDLMSETSSSSATGVNDGDVNSIFLCEFHAIEGPKITLQVPNDHVTKDLFRIVHQYIIPKVPLQGSFLSM